MSRPNLLFLTPTLPHVTGIGSAIRAGATIEALSAAFNLYVIHADIWGPAELTANTDFVRQRSVRYVRYKPQRGELPVQSFVAEHFGGVHFDAVHTFRINMARAAVTMLLRDQARPFAVLDLDDDECRRSERCIELHEAIGDTQRAAWERRELSYLRKTEQLLLPRFDVVCLAGHDDVGVVGTRCRGPKLVHLPNVVFPRAASRETNGKSRPWTILFVGTLNYLPNEDGIAYFCSHILPRIRQNCPMPVRLQIVGASPGRNITDLTRIHPGVEVCGSVPDLEPYYAKADLIVVPLRAGSGTRIKILEAFSYRKPVVSTTLGAEGLGVTDGEQLLIADQPQTFAAACLRLLEDAALGAQLSERAHAWVLANHSLQNVKAVIDSVYERVLRAA